VVLARRTGEPDVYTLNQDELVQAEDAYLARVVQYQSNHTSGLNPFMTGTAYTAANSL
jgi:hypothetical protein